MFIDHDLRPKPGLDTEQRTILYFRLQLGALLESECISQSKRFK